MLLGHKNDQITTHYSAAEIGELIDVVEKVSWSGASAPTLTLIKHQRSRKPPAMGKRENRKAVRLLPKLLAVFEGVKW